MGELNIELFKAVREKIATTPEAYDQMLWGRADSSAPCGTAACIAGWACFLSNNASLEEVRASRRFGELSPNRYVPDIARDALGLDEDEAEILFTSEPGGEWEDYDDNGEGVYYGGWPNRFADMWRGAANQARQAEVAVAYLDHIIETGKVLE
jgi:hypothetical protein